MLTLAAVANNIELSEDQAALIFMTVRSVQQISWWPEWNPKNETVKATQPNWTIDPPRLQLILSVVFTLPTILQPLCAQTSPWLHCCCYSACLQLQIFTLWCPRMYIVVNVAVVLEMYVLVQTNKKNLSCLLFPQGISTYMYVLWFSLRGALSL